MRVSGWQICSLILLELTFPPDRMTVMLSHFFAARDGIRHAIREGRRKKGASGFRRLCDPMTPEYLQSENKLRGLVDH